MVFVEWIWGRVDKYSLRLEENFHVFVYIGDFNKGRYEPKRYVNRLFKIWEERMGVFYNRNDKQKERRIMVGKRPR